MRTCTCTWSRSRAPPPLTAPWRLVQVSKKGAPESPGTWTEYEGPGVANGGGIEWVHDGTAMKMRLKYSLCPDNITGVGASKKVAATFIDKTLY